MPKVTYVESTGTQHVIEVGLGLTVMEGAIRNGLPGIDGDCGGACACATCKVDVDDAWLPLTGVRSEQESAMLSERPDVNERSRLGCQIQVRADLDGLKVYMPVTQQWDGGR
jgi:2Fe-2S ferredoxin